MPSATTAGAWIVRAMGKGASPVLTPCPGHAFGEAVFQDPVAALTWPAWLRRRLAAKLMRSFGGGRGGGRRRRRRCGERLSALHQSWLLMSLSRAAIISNGGIKCVGVDSWRGGCLGCKDPRRLRPRHVHVRSI